MPPMPPAPGPPAAAVFFSSSLSSATSASVVSIRPAIDAAFCSARRVTLAGSMTPAFTRSTYSPVSALKPKCSSLDSRILPITTAPSKPALCAIWRAARSLPAKRSRRSPRATAAASRSRKLTRSPRPLQSRSRPERRPRDHHRLRGGTGRRRGEGRAPGRLRQRAQRDHRRGHGPQHSPWRPRPARRQRDAHGLTRGGLGRRMVKRHVPYLFTIRHRTRHRRRRQVKIGHQDIDRDPPLAFRSRPAHRSQEPRH